MGNVIVSEFVSLDGVMEDPGGAEKSVHGGWTNAYGGDDIWKFKLEELLATDALLLGRITYEGFAAVWPSITDEDGFADRMNNVPKYVVSRTLKDASWRNSRIVNGDLTREVTAIKRHVQGNVLITGSAMLVQGLLALGLIDEYRLLYYPVVLGSGKQLFAGSPMTTLKHTETRSFDSGVVGLIYRRTTS